MTTVGLYRGFSFFNFQKNKTFAVVDKSCVERDLITRIFTPLGSRLMMPSYGTIIPQLIFEPLDEEMIDTLQTELTNVFNYDPRVKLLDFQITPNYDTNSVTATATLFYIELQFVAPFEFNISFEN